MFNKKIKEDKIAKANAEKLINAEERIKKALRIAWSYAQIDGDHHKMWTIDQMVRALCGNDEAYKEWVRLYEAPVGYEDYYRWDTGIAP